MRDIESELLTTIQALNASVWRNRVDAPTIEQWLREFGADCEPGTKGRIHALYLLSRFMFFGDEEVRALLRALYRDWFRYPLIAMVRRQANDTLDQAVLGPRFDVELQQTRFLAMGNPSESGAHLLYHYRQENDLPSDLFISPHEIFDLTQKEPTLANPKIQRYVFIDDFCGSGRQGVRYSRALAKRISDASIHAGIKPKVAYHVLLGTSKGLQRVREKASFDEIACVLELDETFRAFAETSRYFRNPPEGIEQSVAHDLARRYGQQLVPDDALGFKGGQLLLGFVHNTPNNTLPIFWHVGNATRTWSPLFRRYHKLTTQTHASRR